MKTLEFTIDVKSNQKNRTFTIRKKHADGYCVKYRTFPMSQQEFDSAEMNTENDWEQFLKSSDYSVVTKYYKK